MRIVLDSSVSLSWCIPGQADDVALELLEEIRIAGAYVPEIWHTEMSNILGLKARSRVLTSQMVATAVYLIRLLDIETEPVEDVRRFPALMDIMSHLQLTAYDSFYVDLAMRRGLPLATFDKEMKTAARRLGVRLVRD